MFAQVTVGVVVLFGLFSCTRVLMDTHFQNLRQLSVDDEQIDGGQTDIQIIIEAILVTNNS